MKDRSDVHAYCGRGGTRSPPCLPLPIFYWPQRLHAEHQYDNWSCHHHSNWNLWITIHLHHSCAGHLSSVTIPDVILGPFWYALQKSRGRSFKDRDGESKSVSTNMAQGQVRLSMEETKERKGRDKRAIRWLLDNLTEDAEFESFATSIPGTFNGEWSFEVWSEMSRFGEDDAPVIAEPLSKSILNVLGSIPRQLKTCTGNCSSTSANAMLHQPALNSTGTPILSPSLHLFLKQMLFGSSAVV